MSLPTPRLRTDRLELVPLGLEHAASYARHFVDYEVIQHLSAAVPWPYPEGGVRDYIEAVVLPRQGSSRWDWALTLRDAPGEAIGSVGLFRDGVPEHRGFWLSRSRWGEGLMTEAVRPIMDWAFSAGGFEEMVLSNAAGNTRSRRVKEKTGAELVGVKPSRFVRPDYTESELWRVTAESWRAWSEANPTT